MRFIPALCGTCEHTHHIVDGCAECVADGTECTGWVPHPDTIAAGNDQEIRELATLGGQNVLDVPMTEGLMAVLMQLEDDLYIAAAGSPIPPQEQAPALAALGLGPATQDLVKSTRIIYTDYVNIPAEAWGQGINSADIVSIAQQWIDTCPEYPTIAWGLAAYGVVAARPEPPGREAHLVCATDIDGRCYLAVRFLDDGSIDTDLDVAAGWARLMRGELDPSHPDTTAICQADRLDKGHLVTTQLMAATRVLIEDRIGLLVPAPKEEQP